VASPLGLPQPGATVPPRSNQQRGLRLCCSSARVIVTFRSSAAWRLGHVVLARWCMTDSSAMTRRGHRVTVTVAALAIAGAATGAVLAATSRSAVANSGPCQGMRVASHPKRFGWWMHPGEKFSRAWLCSHFGEPRTVAHTRAEVLWRYGPAEPQSLTFVREPDGRFSPA
jgi:hypothetical protein